VSEPGEEHDRHEILAEAGLLGSRTHVLKAGDAFGIFDRHGDIHSYRAARHGVFLGGTRHLSRLVVHLGGNRPLLLGSHVDGDNRSLTVDVTNPDVPSDEPDAAARNVLHVRRLEVLRDDGCRVEIAVKSYSARRVQTELAFEFSADFIDIFELRGARRERRGTQRSSLSPPSSGKPASALLGYDGLDGVRRETRLRFSPAPDQLTERSARYPLTLEPGQECSIEIDFAFTSESLPARSRGSSPVPLASLQMPLFAWQCTSSNPAFDTWLRRSQSDLSMMLTQTAWGPYPYAGVPWFSTPFGRDGLITALATLWLEPAIARGVLRFLAAHQAREEAPEVDAEPGKILHEMRAGEMAALGEIPFGRYYGSVDATPLFLMLAAAYHRRTGDDVLLRELFPSLEAALDWLNRYGDRDGDGFIEYERRSPDGLSNHGWKDSHDSISHADGSLARGSIACCEVQAYAYAARRGLAELARSLGKEEAARGHDEAASALQTRFEEAFWCEELGSYALALDGDKKPCKVRSSNAGHALFAGIASERSAGILAHTLLSPELFSGWGIRTLSMRAPRFNPVSYHNGSVWPHDNALVAAGFSRYGASAAALQVLSGMFEASCCVELARLPELFCGFERFVGRSPTLYPVACAPQAWSAAASLLMLQGALGIAIDARARELRFVRPNLPAFLEKLILRDLRVGDAVVDVRLERTNRSTSVGVLRCDGDLKVLVEI
jgi:glycogen debranching enzyme